MTSASLYKSPAAEKAVMELYDKALAQWPVPYETQTLATRHGDTFVIACGNKNAPPPQVGQIFLSITNGSLECSFVSP